MHPRGPRKGNQRKKGQAIFFHFESQTFEEVSKNQFCNLSMINQKLFITADKNLPFAVFSLLVWSTSK